MDALDRVSAAGLPFAAPLLIPHGRHVTTHALQRADGVAATMANNQALLYHAQGRYREAEPLYGQAVRIVQRLFGA